MALPDSPAAPFPSVRAREFEGPLELLLDEVRRQNVAIENIAMAPVVARFLEYVSAAAGRNLSLDMEWLHMAAILIHWKSRALLPDPSGEPGKDPIRDDLIRQLQAYCQEAAGELARRRAVEETRFSRAANAGPVGGDPAGDEPDAPGLSVWELIRQARDLARWVEQHRADRRRWRDSLGIAPDDVTVSQMRDYLQGQLAVAAEGGLDGVGLLESQATISRRCCLFLGMLEMAREQQVEMEQEETFGPIRLRRAGPRESA